MNYRVAVVDDEKIVCQRLQAVLEKDGYATETFLSGKPFLARMKTYPFDIVFLDLALPDITGDEILVHLSGRHAETAVIIITGHGSIDSAIDAIKKGAHHYITKPFKLEEIRVLADGAREKIALRRENRRLREQVSGGDELLEGFIGTSPAMQELFAMIKKVAMVDCNVLLQGESGTGKELVAKSIHRLSPRRDAPFVSFNCGGFTEELISSELFGYEKGAFTGAVLTKAGLLETAAGGTVFLDEIGEMPMSMQVKLLRVLQEKRILRVGGTRPVDLDIRIVAASNRDIKQACLEGIFREDLFYRLNVVTLQLPRLSERKNDIPLLIAAFIAKYSRPFGKAVKAIAPQALDILMRYHFPGNVRELENIIQRAIALTDGETIGERELPDDLQKLEIDMIDGEGLQTLAAVERRHIAAVLEKTGGNKSLASKILDLPRTTLWRKIKQYRLTHKK
ncbi:Transcriptional regulatory protein ZraR [Desulfosarcina cetonica]|uniref:sigma-54-dependent transcriptional regulator n=1 Tax=Desulfosarcina cetonica TaxID=90730 RepID=UPI0006D0F5E4|nr:sigma-54 dependent transcriptional regulator [Desulfosarcina cetonica]VTR70034.1 Transcriptional regulatory protein ZraR [Desulfosarcina cetonica]